MLSHPYRVESRTDRDGPVGGAAVKHIRYTVHPSREDGTSVWELIRSDGTSKRVIATYRREIAAVLAAARLNDLAVSEVV